jgi:thermostable 8-oxoguanine DNA glycosylase
MIDPVNFTNYQRNNAELEECLLFCVLVAGKNAKLTARLLENLLISLPGNSPFDKCRQIPTAEECSFILAKHRFGCYNMKGKAVHQLVRSGLDLRSCRLEDLLKIHGIRYKTANFFLLHTRKGYVAACLDTHILKFLRERGHVVSRFTPQSVKKYRELERIFLKIAEEEKMTPTDLDLQIWRKYSK